MNARHPRSPTAEADPLKGFQCRFESDRGYVNTPTWAAPVRYAEVDQQGIVFNSHYLLYCDEAMGAYCDERGILELTERIHLVSSTLNWRAPARWGDVVEVDAHCTRVG